MDVNTGSDEVLYVHVCLTREQNPKTKNTAKIMRTNSLIMFFLSQLNNSGISQSQDY